MSLSTLNCESTLPLGSSGGGSGRFRSLGKSGRSHLRVGVRRVLQGVPVGLKVLEEVVCKVILWQGDVHFWTHRAMFRTFFATCIPLLFSTSGGTSIFYVELPCLRDPLTGHRALVTRRPCCGAPTPAHPVVCSRTGDGTTLDGRLESTYDEQCFLIGFFGFCGVSIWMNNGHGIVQLR